MGAEIAQANLEVLRANEYPGRVIIQGLDETGDFWIQLYAVMGRS